MMDKLATAKYQRMLAGKRIKVTKRGKPASFTAKLELYYIILIPYLFNCISLSRMLCFVINVFMCLFFPLPLKGIFYLGERTGLTSILQGTRQSHDKLYIFH